MRTIALVISLAAGAACLSACSDNSRQEAEEAGNAFATDIENAGDRAADFDQNTLQNADAALDRAGDRLDEAADKTRDAAQATRDATGRALENAGEALQR